MENLILWILTALTSMSIAKLIDILIAIPLQKKIMKINKSIFLIIHKNYPKVFFHDQLDQFDEMMHIFKTLDEINGQYFKNYDYLKSDSYLAARTIKELKIFMKKYLGEESYEKY